METGKQLTWLCLKPLKSLNDTRPVPDASPQQEVIRKDWMFKLVGKETFTVGSADTKATIIIEAISGFAYEYTLEVGGKSLQKFIDSRAQTTKTWLLKVDGEDCRVVLGELQGWDYVTAAWSSVCRRECR